MMVLSDTSVGISYFLVSKHTNFIMMAGPMAKHLSTFSRLMMLSIPSVTSPLVPYEPSSVMITTSSELLRTSSSNMIRSLERPASTEMTRLPAAFSACMMGSMGATPTPPPAHTTVPKFSMWVACPSGPTISAIWSPTFRSQMEVDEWPTFWMTSVMVPFSTSAPAMVRGTRSPFSPRRTITKWPALRERAMSGAVISSLKTFSENCCLLTTVYIVVIPYKC